MCFLSVYQLKKISTSLLVRLDPKSCMIGGTHSFIKNGRFALELQTFLREAGFPSAGIWQLIYF